MHRAVVAISTALLIGLAPASAAGDAGRAADRPLAGGLVEERDVALFFDYLRDALSAAVRGRDASPPPELRERAEAIGSELQRRGEAAAHALIDALERSVRERPRERQALPPTVPYQRI